MITDNKMMYHLDRLGDKRPITADVFLTNYCNNKCPYCTYFRWGHSKAHSMPYEDFVKYATRLRVLGVRGIILSGGGEPTICEDFDIITEWLEKEGIPYGINTNFNVPKYFKPVYLKVSLDAYDEDSYERNRGVRAYQKVRENIISYSRWKQQYSPSTTLGIQKVVQDASEIEPFYEANKDLPVDYISFRPVESTDGKYYTDKDITDIFRKITKLTWKDERVVRNFKWDLINTKFDHCIAHWAQIAMDERGNIIYCCHKPYQIIGHVMDEDILEKYQTETDMKMCDVPCRLTAPNMFMKDIEDATKDIPLSYPFI